MRIYQLKESCEFSLISGEQVQIRIEESDSNIYCFNEEGLLCRKYQDLGNLYLVFKSHGVFLCSSSTAMSGLFMSQNLEARMNIGYIIASHVIKSCHDRELIIER